MEPFIQKVTWPMKTDIEGWHVPTIDISATDPYQTVQSNFRTLQPGSVAKLSHESPPLSSVWVPRQAAEGFLLCKTHMSFNQIPECHLMTQKVS